MGPGGCWLLRICCKTSGDQPHKIGCFEEEHIIIITTTTTIIIIIIINEPCPVPKSSGSEGSTWTGNASVEEGVAGGHR
jgi:hypothetical protein